MTIESSDGFTLARGLDPTYPPNKILLLLLPALFFISIGWSLLLGKNIPQSIIFSIIQILLVFLCWAIAREIDPDHDYAAFFGLALLFHPLVLGQGNILILFWFIIALRLLNQTTGKQNTTTDLLFFIFLSVLAVILSSAVLLIILAIVIIVLSSFLSLNRSTDILLSIPLFPSFFLFYLITPNPWTIILPSLSTILFITIASVLLFLITVTTHQIQCTGDHSSHHLSVKRIQSTQIICLLSSLILSVFHGGILIIYPVWTAIIGIGIHRIISLMIKRKKTTTFKST